MNKKDAIDAVSRISQVSGDAEIAHSLEDFLRERFIEHIASLDLGELSETARVILTTNDIDFERWCA